MRGTLLALAAAAGMIVLTQASFAQPIFGVNPGLTAPTVTDVAWRRHWHRHWYGRYPTANSFRRHGRCVEDLGYGRVELCN